MDGVRFNAPLDVGTRAYPQPALPHTSAITYIRRANFMAIFTQSAVCGSHAFSLKVPTSQILL